MYVRVCLTTYIDDAASIDAAIDDAKQLAEEGAWNCFDAFDENALTCEMKD